MRRTVATLLVVASPVLMVVPADAGEGRAARPVAPPVAVPTAVPAAPEVVAPPAVPAPATPQAMAAVQPVVRTVRATAPAAMQPAVRTVRAKAPAMVTVTVDADAAYAARLQAELCQARAVFCGLDRGGRYPAG